mgnify:CR=1 FL=1
MPARLVSASDSRFSAPLRAASQALPASRRRWVIGALSLGLLGSAALLASGRVTAADAPAAPAGPQVAVLTLGQTAVGAAAEFDGNLQAFFRFLQP